MPPTTLHPQLRSAADEAARLVAGITPDRWSDPTPCGDFDLHTLGNHLILWTAYTAERRAREQPVPADLTERDFLAEPDAAAAYAAQLDRAMDAWYAPDLWERDIAVNDGRMPAVEVAGMILTEMVLHGWDVAKATGQPFHCSPAAAEAVWAVVERIADMFRQYNGFGPEVPVPSNAPLIDRALGLSGRDPAWAPAQVR